jgi:aromatic ring hydroxylase
MPVETEAAVASVLMTGEQYEESLRKMKFKVYLQGERVENPVDHPIIRPSMNSVKMTYDLAQDPQHEDLMTATSPTSPARPSTASATCTRAPTT